MKVLNLILLINLTTTFCLTSLAFACPKISPLEASQQMLTLGTEVHYHNRLYYEKAQPVISDAAYDRLFASLVRLEECFPSLVGADSPTRRVGSVLTTGAHLVQHDRPMLSLSSATGADAVSQLLKRVSTFGKVQMLVQPKVDGVPVELIYNFGRFTSASTRGDGLYGENVTDRVREIIGIPRMLTGTFPDRVVVRGEIYTDLLLLHKFQSNPSNKNYSGPRHLVAGVLNARKPDLEVSGLLRFFPFELVTAGLASMVPHSDLESLELLATWGFPVESEFTQTAQTFAEVKGLYSSYLAKREHQRFAMDGIVVKVDDLSLRYRLGAGDRAPFWAAAWKFPPESAMTTIVEIHWTVGRTGRRTPVAEVVPVRLGSQSVTRVSLHNEAGVANLDLAAGDQVVIGLVGDVIPQVLEVIGGARVADYRPSAIMLPAKPRDSCYRLSPVCRDQFLARAVYFTSKSGLGITGLGRKRLERLIDAGLINDLPSLFILESNDVAIVPGFSKRKAERLIVSIRAAANSDDFMIISALGIAGIGPKMAKNLSNKFTSLEALLSADQEQLATLSRADRRSVKTITDFFNSYEGKMLLSGFRDQNIL